MPPLRFEPTRPGAHWYPREQNYIRLARLSTDLLTTLTGALIFYASVDSVRGVYGDGNREPAPVATAVEAIAGGRMAIVVDDPGRENEGDLVLAAQFATPDRINFMMTHGRGLICAPVLGERLEELEIPPMVGRSSDPRGTAFHAGIDLTGSSTGISAAERAATIRALADPTAPAADFTLPGHVFPLRYREGGVRVRSGHTEASVDLCRLAGLEPAAVICEIAADDGQMMKLPELLELGARHEIPVITIADLIAELDGTKRRVNRVSSARVPLGPGDFELFGFVDREDGREHLAAVHGDVADRDEVLVRIHSECLTGDVLGSRRCDCGEQLERSLEMIVEEGAGVVVYLRGHEGRGIGLLEKLRAYDLQEQGLDTVEANLALGHPVDGRDYAVGAEILGNLGVRAPRLLTNNPAKRNGLEVHGVEVASTVPVRTAPTAENVLYLSTKRDRMGHTLDFAPWEGIPSPVVRT
jgi:3,4-dihydroxy 2-butanone 4-phosphate synthase / GTP cyclohydrolase II